MSARMLSARAAAAKIVDDVLVHKHSLTELLLPPRYPVATDQASLCRELGNGVLRYYWPLASVAKQLLHQPLKPKDHDLWALLLVGLYQIHYLDMPKHSAVNETVKACDELRKPWARGLLNALLRRADREQDKLRLPPGDREAEHAHPLWMLDKLARDWPGHSEQIITSGNHRPAMSLRVNTRHLSRDDYLDRLGDAGIHALPCKISAQGIHVTPPVASHALPGFDQGDVSIQDHGAQIVADIVNPRAGERILDACAAPGGKACHLLERESNLKLTLVDISARRLAHARQELQRLGLSAAIKSADILLDDQWYEDERYDCILIDAPCSGSGVIARHPDIKHLRQSSDIDNNKKRQLQLLNHLWPKLAPDGRLVYVTCSMYREENSDVVAEFCRQHSGAELVPTAAVENSTVPAPGDFGRQCLPQAGQGDGFFYAMLSRVQS